MTVLRSRSPGFGSPGPKRQSNRGSVVLLATVVLGFYAAAGWAASPARTVERVPPASELSRWEAWRAQDALRGPLLQSVQLQTTGSPLREFLARIADTQQIAFFLDRRIDPGTKVRLSGERHPLHVTLREIAAGAEAGLSSCGPCLYVGPPESARDLQTLLAMHRDTVGQLAPPARNRWNSQHTFSWPRLSSPQNVLADVAQQARITIQGVDTLPHDLWPEVRLPPLEVVQVVTLLLASLDASLVQGSNNRSVRIVPLQGEVAIQRTFGPRVLAGRSLEQLHQLAPDAQLARSGGRILFRGRWEDFQLLLHGPQPEMLPPQPSTADSAFTFRVRGKQLRTVLQHLATELDLELQLPQDEEVASRLDRSVTITVNGATVDTMLTKVLRPHGLTFQRTGKLLVISLATEP